jgi:CcmD family protein
MSNLTYVFVAFLITWVVIAGYLWMLGRQVQNLKDEVDSLTEGMDTHSDQFNAAVKTEVDSRPVRGQQS